MTGGFAELVGRDVPRETLDRLSEYEQLLRAESSRQNLVSATTLDCFWERHIGDSAQLVRFETRLGASWLDIGSGAGLPGVVVALLVPGSVTLAEPRRLRADFLLRTIDALGLRERVTVFTGKAERLTGSFDMITARAVAPTAKLLEMSTHLSTRNTRWILPKGRNAQSELAEAQTTWQCDAEIVPSRTDPESRILLLSDVSRRGER